MVMEYSETFEDRELTDSLRRVNGKLIDTRWGGGWLTPQGVYHPVNYAKGITHETIADEIGGKMGGSGSISSRPNLMRIYDLQCWMRIVYLSGATFCVQLKGHVSNSDDPDNILWSMDSNQQQQLLRFAKDFRDFSSYFINESFFDSYFSFANAIRKGQITPFGMSVVQLLRERLATIGRSRHEIRAFADAVGISSGELWQVLDGNCRVRPGVVDAIRTFLDRQSRSSPEE